MGRRCARNTRRIARGRCPCVAFGTAGSRSGPDLWWWRTCRHGLSRIQCTGLRADIQCTRSERAFSCSAGSPLRCGSGIPRQSPAGPGGAGRGIPASASRAASGTALSVGWLRLARQALSAEHRQDRSRRHRDAQRIQCNPTRRAQRQSRHHGGYRFFTTHQAVRSGRGRRLPDHRRLGVASKCS